METATIEKFTYEIESNALLDIFSTAGEEEVNKDNFEVLSNKHLTILILASGRGRSTIGDILSEMASSQALEILDRYPFHQKSPEEIVSFLEEMFFTINNALVEYLEVANIDDGATSLSIAIVYKNTLYTAHTGESRIYLVPRDETVTLLSKDPSYSKRISKNTLSNQEKSNYLGTASLTEEQIFVTDEGELRHRDMIFLCSNPILESIPENKFSKDIEEIKLLLEQTPPILSASFLRYCHYERSVKVLRVENDNLEEEVFEDEISETSEGDWRKNIPLLKKIALVVGLLIILLFLNLFLIQSSEKSDLNQTSTTNNEKSKLIPLTHTATPTATPTVIIEEKAIPTPIAPPPVKEVSIEPKETIRKIPITQEEKEEEEEIPEAMETNTSQREILKLIHRAERDLLYTNDIRITFKKKQLIGSKEKLFYEKENDSRTLYVTLDAVDSELEGEIIEKLKKPSYCDGVLVEKQGEKISIQIHIKAFCHYSRSNWAEKSGLDLLTFDCEE